MRHEVASDGSSIEAELRGLEVFVERFGAGRSSEIVVPQYRRLSYSASWP